MLVVSFFVFANSFGQQDPLFGQYMFNPQTLNPAYVGSKRGIDASVFRRDQYNSFRGGAAVNSFTVDAPLHYGQLGAGFTAIHQSLAGVDLMGVYGAAAYKLNAMRGVLALGLELGLQQYAVSFDYLKIHDLSDQIISAENNSISPDVGVGAWYSKKGFYLGASVRHLLEPLLVFDKKNGSHLRLRKHYYVVSALDISINQFVTWKPSILVKDTYTASAQVDLSNHLFWNDVAWVGVSYRTSQAVGVHAGVIVNSLVKSLLPVFKLGYSYELAIGQLSPFLANSHEVFVTMDFLPRPKLKKLRHQKIIQSPVIF